MILAEFFVSAGHICDILALIDRIDRSEEGGISRNTLVEAETFHENVLESIIEKAAQFDWIQADGDWLMYGAYAMDFVHHTRIQKKRIMLLQMIERIGPQWQRQLKSGPTKEFIRRLDRNEKQLFREFGLTLNQENFIDAEAERWWKTAQAMGWKIENSIKIEHGNIGEALSMEWEEQRTGNRPIWMARVNGNAGYDLKSIHSMGSNDPLFIEVKATTGNTIYVTINEADVCLKNPENYTFHVWKLNPSAPKKSLLLTIEGEEVLQHIPIDRQRGQWQVVRIPMSAFGVDRLQCPFP